LIYIDLPYLPPTTNHAYQSQIRSIRGKRVAVRVLSEEGRKFKREASSDILKEAVTFQTSRDKRYGLAIVFNLTRLENATWPKKTQNRFSRVDVSNRIKLLEDALAETLGIDDSQFFPIVVTKAKGNTESGSTRILVWSEEEDRVGQNFALRLVFGLQPHRAIPEMSSGWEAGTPKHK